MWQTKPKCKIIYIFTKNFATLTFQALLICQQIVIFPNYMAKKEYYTVFEDSFLIFNNKYLPLMTFELLWKATVGTKIFDFFFFLYCDFFSDFVFAIAIFQFHNYLFRFIFKKEISNNDLIADADCRLHYEK